MIIEFATCDRKRALGFIRKVYPSYEVTEEIVKPLLDLVEQDIVRIQDPMMYGDSIRVVAGKKWDESKREAIALVCQECVTALKGEGECTPTRFQKSILRI